MNLKKIAKYILAVAVMSAATSCKESEPGFTGNPDFVVQGVENNDIPVSAAGTANASDANGMTQLNSGIVYQVEAHGDWELIPVLGDGEEAWSRIHPLSGSEEGVIRVYALKNSKTEKRTAVYKLKINGVEQPQTITITQESVPVTFVFSASSITLKTKGGSSSLSVNANVDWDVVADPTAEWLKVERKGNSVVFTAPNPNDTGSDLTTKVYIVGKAPHDDKRFEISVTQVSTIFYEDFSWLPEAEITGQTGPFPPVCWTQQTNCNRLDQWVGKKWIDKLEWTGVAGAQDGPRIYNFYHYCTFGTSAQTGNMCSPAFKNIAGEITGRVSWNMAGFVTKKGVRAQCNLFYVALLGPGRITEATAGGTSTGEVATGRFTIPYLASGSGAKGVVAPDIQLSEIAKFTIGSNGYFSMEDPTGLEVWKAPEVSFSIRVEGMTSATRIVIIGGEADMVNMLNGWVNAEGTYVDARKCFDNFSVVAE